MSILKTLIVDLRAMEKAIDNKERRAMEEKVEGKRFSKLLKRMTP